MLVKSMFYPPATNKKKDKEGGKGLETRTQPVAVRVEGGLPREPSFTVTAHSKTRR